MGIPKVEEPEHYQAKHGETNILLIFHAAKTSGNVLVWDWKYLSLIDASGISKILESNHPGLCETFIPFHVLTGCVFTLAFYRKVKALPYSILEKDPGAAAALRSLCTNNVSKTTVFEFLCRIYGFRHLNNIEETRYQSFIKMTCGGKIPEKVREINCVSLPPCPKTLEQHIL